MKLVFDIETNGLDWTAPGFKIHCLCTRDVDTGEERVYTSDPCACNLEAGMIYLCQAEAVIGHYVQFFDIPALEHVLKTKIPGKPFDTKVIAALMFPELDGHALKDWGERLGDKKGDYLQTGDFSRITPEMIEYCQQDVRVTEKLYKHLLAQNWAQESIDLEMNVATIIQRQIARGFAFDESTAAGLYAQLCQERDELTTELQELFPAWTVSKGTFIPKRDNRTLGYVAGVPVERTEIVQFNPQSTDHIADRLINVRGWKPTKFTPTGKPAVDEWVLDSLPYPEARQLLELTRLKKLLGYIGEGKEAWLKTVKNGRIHGRVYTTGVVTGRMSHGSPNLAQVPSKAVKWGKECRALFKASQGKVLIGADASGLELRCLAHFMGRYDDGAYAKQLIAGDIHAYNASLLKKDRDVAKRFIYAFLYGAGISKLASILECKESDARLIRTRFLKGLPALDKLLDDVKANARKGWIFGLDKRKLYIRSEHAALNTLLQSAGAILMKKALCIAVIHNPHIEFVANIHDEFQVEAHPDEAEQIGQLLVQSIKDAGTYFNLRCPLDGEYKIGTNWSETH